MHNLPVNEVSILKSWHLCIPPSLGMGLKSPCEPGGLFYSPPSLLFFLCGFCLQSPMAHSTCAPSSPSCTLLFLHQHRGHLKLKEPEHAKGIASDNDRYIPRREIPDEKKARTRLGRRTKMEHKSGNGEKSTFGCEGRILRYNQCLVSNKPRLLSMLWKG